MITFFKKINYVDNDRFKRSQSRVMIFIEFNNFF